MARKCCRCKQPEQYGLSDQVMYHVMDESSPKKGEAGESVYVQDCDDQGVSEAKVI